jgi:rhomboid family protein
MAEFKFTRPDSFPPILKNLIIINVIVWIAQAVFDEEYGLTAKLVLWPVTFPYFEPYQLFTNMFAHGGLTHVGFNMLGLYIFGRTLENRWGPKRFLFFYLACGLGAAILHLIMQFTLNDVGPVLGASGAVMGVVIGFAYLFPNTEFSMMFMPITLKAKWMAILYVAGDLFGGFGRVSDGIAHFAHLGGALTGFLIVFLWNKTNRKTFY